MGHLWGCVIARPVKYEAAFQRLVNILATDPSLKIRPAAARAAEGFDNPSKVAETIRKRYTRLKKAGQLPAPQDQDAIWVREILGHYEQHEAQTAEAKRKLAEAEKEAVELKMDISPDHLPALIRGLQVERDTLFQLLHARPDMAFSQLLQQGITADQVAAYLSEAANKVKKLEVLLKLAKLISDLRLRFPA